MNLHLVFLYNEAAAAGQARENVWAASQCEALSLETLYDSFASRRQVDPSPSQGILSESLLFIEPLTSSHSLASTAQPGIPSADLVTST